MCKVGAKENVVAKEIRAIKEKPRLGVVVHICNTSTHKAEIEDHEFQASLEHTARR
jgi:hypothetical protein